MFKLLSKFFIIYSFVSFGFGSHLRPNDLEFSICIGNILCLGLLYTYVYITKCIVLQLFSLKKTALYYFWKKLKNICIRPMHMIILKTKHQDICIIILHIVFDTVVPRFLKMQYAPLLEALLLAHRSICRITFNLFSPTPAVIQ